ncbi:alpha/beta hydrolase [Gordonia sp. NPDC003585]|uniref:alpha/beta fold hydrolase n=1 Tax=Gordonia sp. NPDC003585 TaxID=3154275 RepID=UPI0033AE41FE
MSYLAVENDRRIYFEHHTGTGRAVVLLHGWGANTRCWDTVAPALRAAGHEVVLIDLRACGKSDKDFDDVSIDSDAADVVAVVDHLSLQAPVINGWSFGGAVATAAVAKLGDRAGGLVLTGRVAALHRDRRLAARRHRRRRRAGPRQCCCQSGRHLPRCGTGRVLRTTE